MRVSDFGPDFVRTYQVGFIRRYLDSFEAWTNFKPQDYHCRPMLHFFALPIGHALAQNHPAQPVADWAALAASLENCPGVEDFRVVLQPSSVIWNVDREIKVKGGNKTATLLIDGGNNTLKLTQSVEDYL
jgi:hypothetical protein